MTRRTLSKILHRTETVRRHTRSTSCHFSRRSTCRPRTCAVQPCAVEAASSMIVDREAHQRDAADVLLPRGENFAAGRISPQLVRAAAPRVARLKASSGALLERGAWHRSCGIEQRSPNPGGSPMKTGTMESRRGRNDTNRVSAERSGDFTAGAIDRFEVVRPPRVDRRHNSDQRVPRHRPDR